MSASQKYGRGTRLDPPITIGGKAYGYAWLFSPAPSGNNEGTVVGTGIIQAVEDLGGGRWKVVCKRGYQMSDFDKYIEGEGVTHVITQHLAGGNNCHPREWMRALSHANELATRGSLEALRLVVGDGVRFTRGTKRYLWEVSKAVAYGHRNDVVNYVGELGTVPPSFLLVDVNEVAVTRSTILGDGVTSVDRAVEGGTLWYETGQPAPFDGAGLRIFNGSVYTPAERLIFENPTTGADDPLYLPANFGSGVSGVKYWWNPFALEARLLSDCAGAGTQALLSWYVKNVLTLPDAPKDSPCIAQGISGCTGFGIAGDQVVMSAFSAAVAFDVHLTVYQEGFAGWRLSTISTCPGLWASIDSGGVVTVRKRDTSVGTFSTLATSAAFTFPFQVRIERAAGIFNVYARQTLYTGSWTLIATGAPSSVIELATGLIGFGVESNRASAYALDNVSSTVARTFYQIGDAKGQQHFYRYKTVPFVVSRQFPVGSSQPITSIKNLSTDQVMTPSASPRRDHYGTSGGNLVFYSESSGDNVQIEYQEFTEVPPGPGVPPRTFNQPNLATFAPDPNPDRLATEDPDENLINWSDYFEMHVEIPGWTPLVGEQFEIVKGAGVWPHDAELDVLLDFKNDGSHDWETVSETDLFILRYRGLVLMTESLRAAHPTAAACLQVDGNRYVVESVSESVNEFKHALESLEGLWVNLGSPEGGFGGISGHALIEQGNTTQSVRFHPSAEAQTWWPDGCTWGTSKETIDGWWERDIWNPGPPPGYLNDSMPYWYGFFRRDLRLRTPRFPELPIVHTLTPPPAIFGDAVYEVGPEDVIPNEYRMQYNPFGTDGPNRFGSALGPDIIAAGIGELCGFSLAPVGFNIRRLATIPAGAVVLEAYIRVRFTDLKYQSWSYEQMIKLADNSPLATVLESRIKLIVNGHIAVWEEFGTGIDDTFEPPPVGYEWTTTGKVSFAAIAVRRNSRNVVSREGTVYEVPAYEIISSGPTLSGGGTIVLDGEWTLVECADLVRFALSLRDSAAAADGIMLVPSVGAPSAGSPANADSLGAYFDSLRPTLSSSFEDGFPDWFRRSFAASGSLATFDTLECGDLMVRFRLGNKPTEWMALPLVTPAMI